jgi:hypothetical protein
LALSVLSGLGLVVGVFLGWDGVPGALDGAPELTGAGALTCPSWPLPALSLSGSWTGDSLVSCVLSGSELVVGMFLGTGEVPGALDGAPEEIGVGDVDCPF